jgi:hypothetical protein
VLHSNTALPQAAYPFNSNQNKALLGVGFYQKTREEKKANSRFLD